MTQLLVIHDDTGGTRGADMEAAFSSLAAGRGHETFVMGATFAGCADARVPGAGNLPDVLAEKAKSLGRSGHILVVSTPAYWLSLSRRQKGGVDIVYNAMLPEREASSEIAECALLLCTNAKESDESVRGCAALFAAACARVGVADAGVAVINPEQF